MSYAFRATGANPIVSFLTPIAVAALFFAAGCETAEVVGDPYFALVKSSANVYARQAQSKVLKIAVMPFKASTELIGSSVSDMTVTELLRTQKYSLVERGQMAKVLSETELAMAGLSETKAVEAAKMLGAEAVVIGTVDEYGMQAKGGDTYAVVGLSIRLIDCSNGKIIWSADLAKMADDDDTPLATHARTVVHELVSGLYQNLTGQCGDLPPPTPTGVTVSDMGMREATISWTKPVYPSKYRIERANDVAGPFLSVGEVDAMSGSYTDSRGLKDSETYYYRVMAMSKQGQGSDPSAVVETMTAPPPDPPVAIQAKSPSSRKAVISWNPPQSGAVSRYRIERIGGSGGWRQVGESSTTTFTDGGVKGCDLADSATYRYRVFSVNRVGSVSVASETAETTTPPPPAKVAAFAATADQVRCMPLSWRQSAEADVSGYEIERAEGIAGFQPVKTITGRHIVSFEDGRRVEGDLRDGVTYRYRIRSFNSVGGKSEWSKEVTARTKPMPTIPTGLEVSKDLPGHIALSWNPNPEDFVKGYTVESRGESGWFRKELGFFANAKADERELKPGEARLYRIRADDRHGRSSEWSREVAGCARPLPPPPRNLRASRTEGGYTVTVTPPRDGMKAFQIYRKKFIGMDLLVRTETNEAFVPQSAIGEGIDIVATSIDECNLESEPCDKIMLMQ